jgi:predicted permease
VRPREIVLRLVAWLRRDRHARDLARELEAHAELLARDLEHDGMTTAAARAAARRQLGNATIIREASRDAWGFPAVDAVIQDVRYALRGLVHAPGFTATVVLTLGLGIGANTAMFAVIDRLMFRPFPYLHDPGTVNSVYLQTTINGRRNSHATIPYTRFLDIRRATHSFSQYAAVSEWRVAVGTGQETRVRKVAGVSASFFGFFAARPARGRFFGAAEDVIPIGAFVAVLGHDCWQSAFGGRDVIGERLQIGSHPYTIVGVAPKGFVGTVQGRPPELFIPVTTVPAIIDPSNRNTYFTLYNWDWIEVLVRRKPGVSASVAATDLTTAFRRSRSAQRMTNPRVLPDSIAHPRALAGAIRSAAGPDAGAESRVLLWVSGVAVIVLLIACANVTNLMLARVLRRRREIAVRLALGVSRARLVVQFVLEGTLLASFGIGAGLLLAQWGGAAIRTLLLPEGSSFNLGTDWRSMGAAAACALGAILLTAVGPAVLAARTSLTADLKAGLREGSYRRSAVRSALLVMQGALSVVLLVGAGLFVRSLSNVLAIPLGYDARPVIELFTDLRGRELDSASMLALQQRLLETARAIPGVEAAARVNSGLFRTNTTTLRVPGIDSVERLGRFNVQVTTADYFRVMRTRILRGRGFAIDAGAGRPPEVVVSAAMARALWPGQDPLGKCIGVSWDAAAGISPAPCTTVVGVAEDVAQQGITDEQRFLYYLNADEMGAGWSLRTMLVRMATTPGDADLERVRREMQAALPGDGFVIVRPLQEVVDDQSRSWRLGATLFVAFGGLALAVAAVGLYGVIGYTVAQRMHELAMRIALGARSTDIVRLVLGQGIGYALAGVAIGIALARFAAPWLGPLLYKQPPRDPMVFAAVGAIMIAVGLVASAVPAARAVRADPNRALRAE